MPNELWTEVPDIVQETGIRTIPMEKKCKKAKWLSEEALQIAVKRRLGQESQASSCLRKGTPLASRVAAGFWSYDVDFRLPLVLALGSPNFPSSCEGKLDVVLESLQGQRDLI